MRLAASMVRRIPGNTLPACSAGRPSSGSRAGIASHSSPSRVSARSCTSKPGPSGRRSTDGAPGRADLTGNASPFPAVERRLGHLPEAARGAGEPTDGRGIQALHAATATEVSMMYRPMMSGLVLSLLPALAVPAAASLFTYSSETPVSDHPVRLTAGDLDGDGDLDLVVCGQPGAVTVLLNDGFGRFAPAPGS